MTDADEAAARLKTFGDNAEALAKLGDYQLLIVLARIGCLTKSQQRLVADILAGKLKRRKGKPCEIDRYLAIGSHVLDLERGGWKASAAVFKTAEDRKVPESTVWTARRFATDVDRLRRLIFMTNPQIYSD